jgi:hypothetical protein
MGINFPPVVTYAVGLQPCSNGSWLSTNFSNDTYVVANDNPITPYVGQGPATIQVSGAKNVIGGVMVANNSHTFMINTVGAIIYIDNNSTCTVGCGSSEVPWPSIQQGIDAAYGDDDTVIVKEGTYSGPINFHGKAITVQSVSGPKRTIIQGGGSIVSFISGEGLNSILDGFTITGGTGSYCRASFIPRQSILAGGGIAITNDSSPTIRHCIITGNIVSDQYGGGIGGGIFIQGTGSINTSWSGATITNCTISNNSALVGGGLFGQVSFLNMNGCNMTKNKSDEESYGCGAMRIYGYNISITNSNITENEGGICVDIYTPPESGTASLDNPSYDTFNRVQKYKLYSSSEGENPIGITHNNIYGNGDNSYAIANQVADNVTATNNWWGTTDTAVIEAKIFDQNDDSTKGTVSYLPVAEQELVFGGQPTMIKLSYFKADPSNDKVIINWSTESEINNAGFNLYRSESKDGQYVKINNSLTMAKGSSTQGAIYEFIDNEVQNRMTYYYKLEDIDLNGKSTMHGPVKAVPRLIYGIGK